MNNSDNPKNPDLSQQQGPFIERCPHDAENPYVQINRDLLRDSSLTPTCRWLISYLLSFDRTWKIRVAHICETQNLSKESVWKYLNEAIKAGYIKRQEYIDKGLKRFNYLLSESAKFKECLPCTEKPGMVKPGMVFPCTKERTIDTSFQSVSNKKKQFKERSEPPSASRVAKAPLSADASEIYDHFLKRIRERKPDFKEPPRQKWEAEIDRMLRLDKRDKRKVMTLIDWITQGNSFPYVMSPKALRDKYDQQESFMANNLQELKKKPNQKLYYETRAKCPNRFKSIRVKAYGIVDEITGRDAGWDLPEKVFAEILANMIGAKAYEN